MNLITTFANARNLIAAVSGYTGIQFNPLALIKAVNYFHSLGYHKSLQILLLYCYLIQKIEDWPFSKILNDIDIDMSEFALEPQRILMVARLLFIPKNKQMSLLELLLGEPDIKTKDASLFPWFPLHLYEDIPFCLPMEYTLFGYPVSPGDYINWCREECQIRETPLKPNNNPLESVNTFLKSEEVQTLETKRTKSFLKSGFPKMLRSQALLAVSNVYFVNQEELRNFFYYSTEEAHEFWTKHKKAFAKLNVVWNPTSNEYERKDGSQINLSN